MQSEPGDHTRFNVPEHGRRSGPASPTLQSGIAHRLNDIALNAGGFSGANDCIERTHQKVFVETLTFIDLVKAGPC
jgi:hypothetical protein